MTFSDFDNNLHSVKGALGVYPCTLAQERIWAASKEPGAEAHNIGIRWLIHGSLTHATVEAAFGVLVRRHEILRTSFRDARGKIEQVVWDEPPLKIREINLMFMGEEDRLPRAEEIASVEANQPMDLTSSSLFRVTVLRFGPERAALLLTLHSIIADGWSVGILIDEFQAVATALASGASQTLPAPELQFADYAFWERETLASGALDASRAYWRRHLRNRPPTHVAPDRPRVAGSVGRSMIRSELLPASVSQEIESAVRAHGTTLYGVAAASLAAMLRRVTGETQISFNSQVANREDPLAESIVGPIVNSITLCFDVDDDLPIGQFVKQSADSIGLALSHQRLPAEAMSGPPHTVNLTVQRAYPDASAAPLHASQPFQLISVPSLATGALWELNFFMVGRKEGWRISCEADTDLFDEGSVDLLLSYWRTSLEALARSSEDRFCECETLQRIHPRAPNASPSVARRRSAVRWKSRREIPLIDPARHVVRLNEGGSRTPVIALNNVTAFYPLAEKLGADRPFIDIQLHHPDGPFDLPNRAFEDFAADAVQLIRWAQPTGPYILSGHCVFGALAFEAARQLQRGGEEISLIVLFDSWAPGYRETMPWYDKVLRFAQVRTDYYAYKLREHQDGNFTLLDSLWRAVLRKLGLEPGAALLPCAWYDNYLLKSFRSYRPNAFDGDMLVIRTAEALQGRLFDDLMGWAPFVTGELRKFGAHCRHANMFQAPQVTEVAEAVTACLADIEGR